MQLSYMFPTQVIRCVTWWPRPFEVHAALRENTLVVFSENTLAVFSTTCSSTAPETLSYEKCLLQSKYYNNILLLEVILVKLAQVLCCMKRIQTKMAAYISSSSTPKINWAARDMLLEYLNFEDMCELMFYGPMMDCLNNEEAKFAHMSLWGGSNAIELFNNNSLSVHKTSANFLLCLLKYYCCEDTSVKSSEEHFTSDEINEKCDLFCLEDNEHFNELSSNKGTFDDEIFYYLDKADQDYKSYKVCNDNLIAKSYF